MRHNNRLKSRRKQKISFDIMFDSYFIDTFTQVIHSIIPIGIIPPHKGLVIFCEGKNGGAAIKKTSPNGIFLDKKMPYVRIKTMYHTIYDVFIDSTCISYSPY